MINNQFEALPIRALGWAFWKTLCWPVKGTNAQPLLNIIYQEYQQLKS